MKKAIIWLIIINLLLIGCNEIEETVEINTEECIGNIGREPDALFIDCKGKCGAGYNMPPPKERLIAYRKDGELVLGVEDASNIEKEKEEG